MKDMKDKMKVLGVTQVDLILKLREVGIVVQPPEMSQILSGVATGPKATRVLEVVAAILDGMEAEHES